MASAKAVIAAALAGCLTINSVPASADETGVSLGAVFRLPFNGGLARTQKSKPRIGLGASMRMKNSVFGTVGKS